MDNQKEPLYMQIYRQLKEDLIAGKYSKNQLISEHVVSKQFFVSRITSRKALDMLAEENLIIRVKGKGSYVSPHVMSLSKKYEDAFGRKPIGVIFPDIADSFGRRLLVAIDNRCREHNILCMFCRSEGNQEREQQCIEEMIEYGVAGIIIMPVHDVYYNATVLKLILDGFPVVVIDRELKNIPAHFVGSDNIEAGKNAMDFLIQLGHKKIGIYSHGLIKTSSIEDRLYGIQTSLKANNLTDGAVYFENIFSTLPGSGETQDTFENDFQAVMAHLQENLDITAIVALEYQIAMVVKSAAYRLGIDVPKDLSILCFDSPARNHGNALPYEFTHIRQDEETIGQEAFDLLLSLTQSLDISKPARKIFPCLLECGASTCMV